MHGHKTSHLPIRYFLALLWAHPILHISTISVKLYWCPVSVVALLCGNDRRDACFWTGRSTVKNINVGLSPALRKHSRLYLYIHETLALFLRTLCVLLTECIYVYLMIFIKKQLLRPSTVITNYSMRYTRSLSILKKAEFLSRHIIWKNWRLENVRNLHRTQINNLIPYIYIYI